MPQRSNLHSLRSLLGGVGTVPSRRAAWSIFSSVGLLRFLCVTLSLQPHVTTANAFPSWRGEVQEGGWGGGEGNCVAVVEANAPGGIKAGLASLCSSQCGERGAAVLLSKGTFRGVSNTGIDPATLCPLLTQLTVSGAAGPGNSIIDGENKFSLFSLSARGFSLNLSNLTLCNGVANITSDIRSGGGALSVTNGARVVADGVRFENNKAPMSKRDYSAGGAVFMSDAGSSVFRGCTFRANSAPESGVGGAVYAENSSPSFERCDFSENFVSLHHQTQTPQGGAVAISTRPPFVGNGGTSTPTNSAWNATVNAHSQQAAEATTGVVAAPIFTDCSFVANVAMAPGNQVGGQAGAVNIQDSSPTFIRCQFVGNSAEPGLLVAGLAGAVAAISESSPAMVAVEFIDCLFVNNSVPDPHPRSAVSLGSLGQAGAVSMQDVVMRLFNCSLFNNSAGMGGAVGVFALTDKYLPALPSLLLSNSSLRGNQARQGGAAFVAGKAIVSMENTELQGNTASQQEASTTGGGALLVWGPGTRIDIKGGAISNNPTLPSPASHPFDASANAYRGPGQAGAQIWVEPAPPSGFSPHNVSIALCSCLVRLDCQYALDCADCLDNPASSSTSSSSPSPSSSSSSSGACLYDYPTMTCHRHHPVMTHAWMLLPGNDDSPQLLETPSLLSTCCRADLCSQHGNCVKGKAEEPDGDGEYDDEYYGLASTSTSITKSGSNSGSTCACLSPFGGQSCEIKFPPAASVTFVWYCSAGFVVAVAVLLLALVVCKRRATLRLVRAVIDPLVALAGVVTSAYYWSDLLLEFGSSLPEHAWQACVGGLCVQGVVAMVHFILLLCCFLHRGGRTGGAGPDWVMHLADHSTVSGLVFVCALLKLDFLLILGSGVSASTSAAFSHQMTKRLRCLALVAALRDAVQVAVSVTLKVLLSRWGYLSIGTVVLSLSSLLLTFFRCLVARHSTPGLQQAVGTGGSSSGGNDEWRNSRSSSRQSLSGGCLSHKSERTSMTLNTPFLQE